MRLLSVDPGGARFNWALLASIDGARGRARFLAGGGTDASAEHLRAVLHVLGETPDVIAVERPMGYIHEHKRGAAMLDTANVAGGVAWAAQFLGIPRVVEMPRGEWVKRLLGVRRGARGQFRGTAGDHAVNAALLPLVEGMPARTSQDMRDAIALGLVAMEQEVERAALARRTGS